MLHKIRIKEMTPDDMKAWQLRNLSGIEIAQIRIPGTTRMEKLFMLLIGCSPAARNIEQHDVFFGIGNSIKDLVPDIFSFWPDAKGTMHVDAWREVTIVNGFSVKVMQNVSPKNPIRLFFINLGGYKRNEFEEFHYKILIAASGKSDAIKKAKQTAFFQHTGFKGANSHIDDRFGVDVDDIHEIRDILSPSVKKNYGILLEDASPGTPEDEIHLGYYRLDQIDKWYLIPDTNEAS